jgi:hypothetical protein
MNWSTRQFSRGHRAQSRSHQDGRLGHRLGPEGGDGGGEIVAEGTPEDIVKIDRSYTGQFLKELLERRPGRRVEAAE